MIAPTVEACAAACSSGWYGAADTPAGAGAVAGGWVATTDNPWPAYSASETGGRRLNSVHDN